MTVPIPVTTTTTTTTTRVRTERTHWVRRGFVWIAAPFVDNWSGLSLNRFLAVLFGVTAVWPVLQKAITPITWPGVALATVAGSLAFGKDIWTAFLNRDRSTPTPTTTTPTSE